MNSDTTSSQADLPPVHILLVEDNKIDARLTCNALRRIPDWPSVIRVLDDGEKAVDFFRSRPQSIDAPLPDLVILDMNLPKYDGIEVLQTIRASADLRHLLVFVFSSAPAHVSEDLMNKAQVKADFYFEKPNEVSSFYSIAAKIRDTYRSAGSTRRL